MELLKYHYCLQFQDHLDKAAQCLLATKSLTQFQSRIIQLPTWHSGLSLNGPLDTMHQAFVGSAGVVARFHDTISGWHDRAFN